MKIDILTLFPEMFYGPLNCSILRLAQEKGIVEFDLINIRDFTKDKHRKVDDYPYGGGPGMVMKPEPIYEAIESLSRGTVILLTPRGQVFTQELALKLSKEDHLIIICGHYEGVDERVSNIADLEISIGDYVLTGGEVAALVVIDATLRLIPGVVGNYSSVESDSFSNGLLDYPHYTRPQEYRGMRVPDVLLSGDHERIRKWRRQQALLQTLKRRPELLKNVELTKEDMEFLKKVKEKKLDGQYN
jgi:tRNA (guanine37-N1)-methyltransferase